MIRALVFGMWTVGAADAVLASVIALVSSDPVMFLVFDVAAIIAVAFAAIAWKRIP